MLSKYILSVTCICSCQVAHFFDSTLEHGADAKLAANWIMGDMTAYLKDAKLSIDESKLTPLELSEMIAFIRNGTISGKIGKEVTFNYVVCVLRRLDLYFS